MRLRSFIAENQILFLLLLGSGREKSEPFIQNRITLFSISHTVV